MTTSTPRRFAISTTLLALAFRHSDAEVSALGGKTVGVEHAFGRFDVVVERSKGFDIGEAATGDRLELRLDRRKFAAAIYLHAKRICERHIVRVLDCVADL